MAESTKDVSVSEAVWFGIKFGVLVTVIGTVLGFVGFALLGSFPDASPGVLLQYAVQFLALWTVFGTAYRYFGGESPF